MRELTRIRPSSGPCPDPFGPESTRSGRNWPELGPGLTKMDPDGWPLPPSTQKASRRKTTGGVSATRRGTRSKKGYAWLGRNAVILGTGSPPPTSEPPPHSEKRASRPLSPHYAQSPQLRPETKRSRHIARRASRVGSRRNRSPERCWRESVRSAWRALWTLPLVPKALGVQRGGGEGVSDGVNSRGCETVAPPWGHFPVRSQAERRHRATYIACRGAGLKIWSHPRGTSSWPRAAPQSPSIFSQRAEDPHCVHCARSAWDGHKGSENDANGGGRPLPFPRSRASRMRNDAGREPAHRARSSCRHLPRAFRCRHSIRSSFAATSELVCPCVSKARSNPEVRPPEAQAA